MQGQPPTIQTSKIRGNPGKPGGKRFGLPQVKAIKRNAHKRK